MTNQRIVDLVDDALPSRIPMIVREKILDAIWRILNDEMGIDLE